MKIQLTALAAVMLLAPTAAVAGNSLDVFYVYNELDEQGGQDPDGHGVGIRGEAMLGHGISLTGLYQSSDLDNSAGDTGARETRIGLKYGRDVMGLNVTGEIEQANLTFNDKANGSSDGDNGFAVKVGASIALTDSISAYAKVGYLNLHEAGDGGEYEVGASMKLIDNISGFVEYRYIDIKEGNANTELSTLRVGGRYTF